MTDQKHCTCPHEWIQPAPFIPAWVVTTPAPKVWCPQPIPPVVPNPTFPKSATQQICTPLRVKKTGPGTVLITVSIPAESIITLPTNALEIKKIKKNLKITQSRFFNRAPQGPGIPWDTPKLFLGGFVRKDIQYSEAVRQTATTVEGVIKDFVADIPISCVIDLGKHLIFPRVHYDQQSEYGFASSTPLHSGFSGKDQLLSNDLTGFNVLSQEFYNPLPDCQLIYSQINEMDEALDRVPLQGGPFEEGTFRVLQEKMIILIQLQLTFPAKIDHRDNSCKPDKDCQHDRRDKDCKHCNHCRDHKHDRDCKHHRNDKN